MYTWKAQMAELETKDTMAAQAAEHIATIWGIDETSEFLACNEGDEVLFIATTINSWYADGEEYEDMDEEDVQEAQRLLAWAQTITTATR